jgi:presequence protease
MKKRKIKLPRVIHGFAVIEVRWIDGYGLYAILLRHIATGMEVIHYFNDDYENLFAFIFKTPPLDNTGLTHILEHSALCGSRNYPLKKPFMDLAYGSLQTYLNASTSREATFYPGASILEKDFFNLFSVYADAVFNPLLREEVFWQEGHHAEDGRVVGVVFNEMLGAHTSGEYLVNKYIISSLFPDTQFRYNSGGNPESIVTLKYGDLLQFHGKYYNPSNCRLVLYGDIPTERHLQFLQEKYLCSLAGSGFRAELGIQERWDSPKSHDFTYGIPDTDREEKKTFLSLSWLIGADDDMERLLVLDLMAEILVGNSGSPLRKALIESRLGEDLLPQSGLNGSLVELFFVIGLRGSEPGNAEKFRDLVLSTLKKLSRDGLDRKTVEAAVNRLEFSFREVEGGGTSVGLRLLYMSLGPWLHGYPPYRDLLASGHFAKLRKKIFSRHFFTPYIERFLLDNKHMSLLTLKPQKGVKGREFAPGEAGVAARDADSPVEKLRAYQQTPDSEENLRKLPSLDIRDLPDRVKTYSLENISNSSAVPFYFHNAFTNGIIHIDLYFDITELAPDDCYFLSLLGDCLTSLGIPGKNYAEVSRDLSLVTGDFSFQLESALTVTGESKRWLVFRLKALKNYLGQALALISSLLREPDFSDSARITDIVAESRNGMKSGILRNGGYFTYLRATSRIRESELHEERWGGIDQYLFLRSISLENQEERIVAGLRELRDRIINPGPSAIQVTASVSDTRFVRSCLERMLKEFPPHGPARRNASSGGFMKEATFETWVIPADNNSIALAIRGNPYLSRENALETILTKLLNSTFLLEEVRLKGGAYFVNSTPSLLDGIMSFFSSKDPNISKTLNAFRESLVFARDGRFTEDQLKRAIIGQVGNDEKPLDARRRGSVALKRKLLGITDQERQNRRDIILSADKKSLCRVAESLIASWDSSATVVLAGEKSLAREAALLPRLNADRRNIPL